MSMHLIFKCYQIIQSFVFNAMQLHLQFKQTSEQEENRSYILWECQFTASAVTVLAHTSHLHKLDKGSFPRDILLPLSEYLS